MTWRSSNQERQNGAWNPVASYMDFADFLDTCRRAGLADTSGAGTVTVRPADDARFRVTWA